MIRISLFRQEFLAVGGKLLHHGSVGDDREKRGDVVFLRTEDPAQSLRLLLAGAETAGNLDRQRCIGEADGKISDLGDDDDAGSTLPKVVVDLLTSGVRRLSRDEWYLEAVGDGSKLIEVLTDNGNRIRRGRDGRWRITIR